MTKQRMVKTDPIFSSHFSTFVFELVATITDKATKSGDLGIMTDDWLGRFRQ